jgi:hypothetical protein
MKLSLSLNPRQRAFLAGAVHRVALLYAVAFLVQSWQRHDGWLIVWYLPLWWMASGVAAQLRKEPRHA